MREAGSVCSVWCGRPDGLERCLLKTQTKNWTAEQIMDNNIENDKWNE